MEKYFTLLNKPKNLYLSLEKSAKTGTEGPCIVLRGKIKAANTKPQVYIPKLVSCKAVGGTFATSNGKNINQDKCGETCVVRADEKKGF